MIKEWMLFWVLLLAVAVMVGWSVHSNARTELEGSKRPEGGRYNSYAFAFALPLWMGLFIAVLLLADGGIAVHTLFTLLVVLFTNLSVYYGMLLLLRPLLRRYFSARACATLWLLPNFLYYLGSLAPLMPSRFQSLGGPMLTLPWLRAETVIALWMAGVAAVLIWKIAGHFRFRRQILKDAREVRDSAVLHLWWEEQREAGYKESELTLVESPAVSTPLSIGFFRATIRVVLPERIYTEEELRLIFRHELIHIGRGDSSGKFFLVFCTALCWFNPLVWLAMDQSAEDMELSCDETVLLGADSERRRRYGELLLRTAGDQRGFTTCLSSTARSLRYRLERVIAPARRHLGGVLVGTAMFLLLLMTCGDGVVVAYGESSWREATQLESSAGWSVKLGRM